MHTVVETPSYLADVKSEALTEGEREAVVEMIANHPEAGNEIGGTGGARKVRVPGRGRGKSGGYRVITFYFRQKLASVFTGALFQRRESESEQSGKERVERYFGGYRSGLQEGSEAPCLSLERGSSKRPRKLALLCGAKSPMALL